MSVLIVEFVNLNVQLMPLKPDTNESAKDWLEINKKYSEAMAKYYNKKTRGCSKGSMKNGVAFLKIK